ncbi:hypothetical protein BGX29_002792 [Mortierella sp. GBA35]|nr:hypothetical protein BGX29_002792 [Mortierella sp. GBA35]
MKQRITKEKKAEALRMMAEGASIGKVSRKLDMSTSTASLIRNTDKENMPIKKAGRPRKLPQQAVDYLKAEMRQEPLKTAVDAQKGVNSLLPQSVSDRTAGLRARQASEKPTSAPGPKSVKERLSFATSQRLKRTAQDHGTLEYGGLHLKIWSCKVCCGPGLVVLIDEPTIEHGFVHSDSEGESEGIDPGVGNVQGQASLPPKQRTQAAHAQEDSEAHIKQRFARYRAHPKIRDELWERVLFEWFIISVKLCRGIIRSMPKRVKAVHKAKGAQTKH